MATVPCRGLLRSCETTHTTPYSSSARSQHKREVYLVQALHQLRHGVRPLNHKFQSISCNIPRRSIQGHCNQDVQTLCNYLSRFGRHPNQLVYKGGVVVSTFAGQDCTFGCGTLERGWEYVKCELERCISRRVHFIPSFFIDPGRYPTFHCMDGYFHVGVLFMSRFVGLLDDADERLYSGMEDGRSI